MRCNYHLGSKTAWGKSVRVAVGLSGGVDSSVAALLLKEQGHDVVGVTMKLWRGGYRGGARDACFGPGEAEDIEHAADLARRIGIGYQVFDCSEIYEREIIRYVRESYLAGLTPNPCVRCNATMKFGLLPKLAAEAGLAFDAFATGHYARIERRGARWALLRAKDVSKDQSYFLYRLSQDQLARHLFPLGDLTKREVREIARSHGLAVADRPDSQDFYAGEMDELIGASDRPGDIVDGTGRVLGHHRGFWHYTIGQRKGLGIGGGTPYYVVDVDACTNRVVVGSQQDVVSRLFSFVEPNWVSVASPEGGLPCRVRVRNAGQLVPARVEDGVCFVEAGAWGVTPGQSAVFYEADGDAVLGGGIIARKVEP